MRHLLRSISTAYLLFAASILTGLVLTPLIIHAIGTEAYGAWAFIAASTALLRLVDFGVAPAVVRFTSYRRGRGDSDGVSRVASSGLAIYAVLGTVSLVAGLVLAWLVPSLVDLPSSLAGAARIAAVLAAAALAIDVPLGLFSSMLKGAHRFDVLNGAALLALVIYAAFVAAVLPRWDTLPALAAIALGATVLRLGIPAVAAPRLVPELRFARALVSRREIRELLSFSGFAFIGQLAGKVVFTADAIVVGVVLGATPVAYYAVASRLFALGNGLAATGYSVLFPIQSELEGGGHHERQRQVTGTSLRMTACVAAFVAAPLVLLPDSVLDAWLPARFDESVPVLALLGAALLFVAPSGLLAQYLLAQGRARPLALAQGGLGALNLTTTAVLVATTEELWTAALSTLVYAGAEALLVLPFLLRRTALDRRTIATAYLRPLLPAAAAAGPTLVLLPHVFDTHTLAPLAAVSVLWTLAFVPLVWLVGLGEAERTTLRRLVRRPGPPLRERAGEVTPEA